MAPVQAACSKCGRKFTFEPQTVRKTCQICGGDIPLPDGVDVAPSPRTESNSVVLTCPICDRSKEVEGDLLERIGCWFCQAPLTIPSVPGSAPLLAFAERPASSAAPLVQPRDDASLESGLVWGILRRAQQARCLGARTADGIPPRLARLREWEAAGGSRRSPLDLRFTAEVLSVGIFNAHDAIEDPYEPGRMLVTFEISKETFGPERAALFSTALGLTALLVGGTGWVATPRKDAEEEVVTQHLDIHLEEGGAGTSIEYSVRSSEGSVRSAGKTMGRDFDAKFPALFARAARGILAFKAAFGMDAPGRLMKYVTRKSLCAQLERQGHDASSATQATDRFFRLMRS